MEWMVGLGALGLGVPMAVGISRWAIARLLGGTFGR